MTKVWPMRLGPNLRFYTRFLLVYKNRTFVQLCPERLKKKAFFWFTSGKFSGTPAARVPILFQKICRPLERSRKTLRESRANPQIGTFFRHKKHTIFPVFRACGRFHAQKMCTWNWFYKVKKKFANTFLHKFGLRKILASRGRNVLHKFAQKKSRQWTYLYFRDFGKQNCFFDPYVQ